MKEKEVKCPNCGAENPIYRKKSNSYICRNEDCEHEFELETKQAPRNIFISYGHDEYEALAKKIKEDLEELGHEVWFDRSKLKAGRDWEIAIEEGLKGTQIMLVMMTPYSMRRPDGYCLNELSMACSLRKDIVPVMVKDCIPPLSIHRIQWLDFKEWPKISEENYKEKFAQIRDVIEGKILSFEGSHTFLLTKLKPIDFKVEIEKHVRNFFGRKWIFDIVKDWLYHNPESRVFFLTGRPGVGKTAISSMLCRKFPEVKAYHLVKFGDTRKSDAIECILSIAYQLSTQISEYTEKLLEIDLEGIREKTAATVFDELIVQPLFDLKPPSKPVLIVIDALDEAKKGDDNILVSFLADNFNLVPPWLKLFITSRPETDILNSLSSLKPHPLDTEDMRNIEDIRGYLQLKLKELFPNKIIDNALEVIIERSEGIFLYVQEVLNELNLGRLDLDHPEKFPKGLTQVYKSYFKRQFPVVEEYNSYQRPLLELITAAREPLDVGLIYDLLNWDDYTKKLSIDPLGSFLEIIDGKISLFHRSLIEWLTNDQTDIKFFISSKKGHENLANQGWKIYESDINNLNLYFLTHLPLHLLKLEEWDKIDKLLSDLRYIERCSNEGLLYDLIKSYLDVLSLKDLPNDNRKKIHEFKQFVSNQAYILQKYPHLTVQQAINQPDNNVVSQTGKDFIKLTGFSQPWIEWVNKPQERDPCIFTFTGHSSAVWGCAFSPDGKKVVSASHDKTLKLWDVETGAEIRTFTGHSDSVWRCAFSSDGTKVVSASEDTTLKLWDVKTGAMIHTFEGDAGRVYDCAFSPDSTKVVSASEDATLKLWDVKTGAKIRTFRGIIYSDWLYGCAFSPDGKKVVSASHDKTLKLWDVETGAEIRTLTGHSNVVRRCAFSADGKKIVSASGDKTLKLWDVETGAEIRTFTGHSEEIYDCAFSPDGKKIVSASDDKTLKLWDVETGAEIRTFAGHSDTVDGCAFSPEGTKILSASSDETLKLWDVETTSEIRTFTEHSSPVRVSAFSPDETKLAFASEERLKLWDVKTGTEIKTFTGHSDWVRGCAFSSDGKKIVSASDDGTLILWDIETGIKIHTFEGHSGEVYDCAFSPDGMKIVSASNDETLKLWNLETGDVLKTLTGHTSSVNGCAFSPDGKLVASASSDKTLRLWDVEMGIELASLKGLGVLSWKKKCAFSPDYTKVVSTSDDMTLKLWDITTDEIKTFKVHSSVNGCAFSPDSMKVLSISDDKTLRLWDINSGNELMIFPTLGASLTIDVGENGLIAVGDEAGWVYFLRVHGVDFTLTEQLGNLSGKATYLNYIAEIFELRGNYPEALMRYEEALQIAIQLGDLPTKAVLLNNIGMIYDAQGNYAEALKRYEEALQIDEQLGNLSGKAARLNNIGEIFRVQGNYQKALKRYEEALQIDEQLGNLSGKATRLNNIGAIYDAQGNYTEALERYEEALQIDEQLGNLSGKATRLNNIGEVFRAQENYSEALKRYEEALQIFEHLEDLAGKATLLNNIGAIYKEQGDYIEALKLYEEALQIDEDLGNLSEKATILNNIGWIYYTQGDFKKALTYFNDCLIVSKQLGESYKIAGSFWSTGTVYRELNDTSKALQNLERALEIYEQLGLENDAEQVREDITKLRKN